MRPIGIFGGSFDPIHLGHVKLAKAIFRKLKLAELRIVPCKRPPHKPKLLANKEQRLIMLKLALAEYSNFVIDNCEMKRERASYTFDTLTYFRQQYPDRSLCFIMSLDSFVNFNTWFKWQETINLAHLIVVHRPFHQITSIELQDFIDSHQTNSIEDLHTKLFGKIYFTKISNDFINISATDIRNSIKIGEDVRQLLPEKVWEFIKQNGLYLGQGVV